MKSKQIINETLPWGRNITCRLQAWEVHNDKKFPENIKYTFVLLYGTKRMLAYDNHEGKGHHRHYENNEESNPYVTEIKSKKDIKELVKKFMREATSIINQIKNE